MLVAWLLAGFSLAAGLLMAFVILAIELFVIIKERVAEDDSHKLEPEFVGYFPKKQEFSRKLSEMLGKTDDTNV